MGFELIFIFILFIVALLYAVLIISYYFFFKKSINNNLTKKTDKNVKISIIIAARNEAHQIMNLLGALNKQNYRRSDFEIIVVDDASEDNTSEVLSLFASQNKDLNIRTFRIEENRNNTTYKKHAIAKAIAICTGDLIVTTDADCVMGENWLTGIANAYKSTNAKMMAGMVVYHYDKSAFEKMQHLDFLSLIASGAAAIQSGYPIMCNGANLVYEKKAFVEVNGFAKNEHFASGDDIFLLLKLKKHYGSKCIYALTDKDTLVYTKAEAGFGDFMHQRLRWSSKTKAYNDFAILLVAAIVFAFNFIIIAALIYGIFEPVFLFYALGLLIVKSLVDLPVMFQICRYINRLDLLKYFLPMQFIYLFYVIFIGIVSNFVSYRWKGRKIKM